MKKNRGKQKGPKKKVPVTPNYSEVRLCEELEKRNCLETPDFLDLKLKKNHFLFVYGTLKTGGRLTGLLDGCPFLGEAETALSAFTMEIARAGHFPILFETKQPGKAAKCLGEVYVVDALKLAELDRAEGNGTMFIRQQYWAWLPDQKALFKNQRGQNVPVCERCWVYKGNPFFWQGRDTIPYPAENRKDGPRALNFTQKKMLDLFDPPATQGPHNPTWNAFLQEELDRAIPW